MKRILFLLALILPANAASAEDSPADIVKAFCENPDQLSVRQMLTPSLAEMIAEAEARNDAIAKANPDEKPPLGDGLPWRSFQDKPDSCEPDATAAREEGGRIEIPVLYKFRDSPSNDWVDTLVLEKQGDRLLIDDVIQEGSADGSARVTMREILKGAFDF